MPNEEFSAAKTFALVVADVFEAAGRLRRAGDAVAREHGQTQSRWQVLSVISEGSWTVPRIAERLGITRQGVQRVADELAAAGLARYERNALHARSVLLAPTAAGRRVLGTIARSARGLDERLGSALGERRLEAVHAGLRRLLEELRELD